MTGDALEVEKVEILRAPGFESGSFPVDEFSSGVNVVHGPNASGKTTLARSVQSLLWPEAATDRTSLSGRLSLDGDAWHVDVDPGRAQYRRDGQEASGPTLPPADQRDRYHLALHDLLQEATRNESFARTIERESAGGYDLAAARDELGFTDSASTRGISEVGEVERALEAVGDATDDVRELRDEQQRLSTLRSALEEAREADERVALLEQAIEYAKANADLEAAQRRVEAFPDVLSALDGDEADEVADIEERIEEWETKRADAAAARADAEGDLEAANLPEEGVPSGTIDRLDHRQDELGRRETERKNTEASLEDARERRNAALSDIPLDVDADDLVELDPDVWETVSEFARGAERVRAEREVREAVDRWLDGHDRPEPDLSTVERGSNALENWLASPAAKPDTEAGETAFYVAITSALLLAVAGGLLAVLVHPVLALFDVLAVGIAWYGYQTRPTTETTGPRETHRETFESLGIEAPEAWTESAVRDRLNDLYDDVAAHRMSERQNQLRETLSTDADELDTREESLDERRSALVDELGVAPETTDVELLAIVRGILRWQDCHEDVVGCRERVAAIEAQIEDLRANIADDLAPYGYGEVADAAEATGLIRDLDDRQTSHESARRELERAEKTIEDARRKIEDLEAERAEIYDAADLPDGQRGELDGLCDQVEDYEQAVSDRDNANHLVEKARADLEAYPGFGPGLAERTAPDLRQEKQELEAVADEYADIQREIAGIEQQIVAAKRSKAVEDALAEKERALSALADQREADCEAMVGHVLVEHVREATQETSRPAVFRRAGDILARITTGRYRLDLARDGGTFRAYDTVLERPFALDELSSGTRIQVLLSVRVAFVEHQEEGFQLPLILDETLANADDEKAGIIVESMLELARDGRQVFYFTAQGDEVARWREALEGTADVDHAFVDLTDHRDVDGHVDVPDLDELADLSTAPPDPAGHDHESYGRELDAPAFDPRRGAGHAHVWYLTGDVDLLARLLASGCERWGQLETLLERTDAAVLTDDQDALADVERAGEALEAFVGAWQKGRGKPVDRQVLADSGAVSGTFIDDVTRLAERYDGDGRRIVRGLRNGEVDRFRSGKTDELEQYFEGNGYVEHVDPLEPEEIRARVVQRLLSSGLDRETAADRADELLARLG